MLPAMRQGKKGDDAYGEWGESERRNDMARAGSKLLDGVQMRASFWRNSWR